MATTARGFHIHANAFWEAAKAVERAEIDDPLPTYFLWGRTIELALKSFLLSEGRTIEELKAPRQFGHNLTTLYEAAVEHDITSLIGSDATHFGIIRVLNFDYISKRYEYRETGAIYHLPDVALVKKFIKRLMRGVDFHLQTQERI